MLACKPCRCLFIKISIRLMQQKHSLDLYWLNWKLKLTKCHSAIFEGKIRCDLNYLIPNKNKTWNNSRRWTLWTQTIVPYSAYTTSSSRIFPRGRLASKLRGRYRKRISSAIPEDKRQCIIFTFTNIFERYISINALVRSSRTYFRHNRQWVVHSPSDNLKIYFGHRQSVS